MKNLTLKNQEAILNVTTEGYFPYPADVQADNHDIDLELIAKIVRELTK